MWVFQRVMFCDFNSGVVSMVRQLQPFVHIEGKSLQRQRCSSHCNEEEAKLALGRLCKRSVFAADEWISKQLQGKVSNLLSSKSGLQVKGTGVFFSFFCRVQTPALQRGDGAAGASRSAWLCLGLRRCALARSQVTTRPPREGSCSLLDAALF